MRQQIYTPLIEKGCLQLSKSETVAYELKEPDQRVVPARAPAMRTKIEERPAEYFIVTLFFYASLE